MVDSIRRAPFIQELQGRSYDVATLKASSGMAGVDLDSADLDANGKIDTPEDLNALFDRIDALDNDGDRNSFRITGRPAGALSALRSAAAASSTPVSPYHDIALARTFTTRLTTTLQRGASGPRIVALQYALTRLNLLHSRVDGGFGGDTVRALVAFQTAHGIVPANGKLNHQTLAAIDAAVTQDMRVAAERVADPFTVLNDFSRLTPLTAFSGTPVDWNNASVQAAYRRFVAEYWPIMRENRLEMDCKTVSLLLVNQFQLMVRQQLGVVLAMPRSADHSHVLPDQPWQSFTDSHPRGLFQRIDGDVRPGYEAVRRVQALDPTQGMLFGVNLRNTTILAHDVAMVAHPIGATLPDNNGDKRKPEVDCNAFEVGDMILINHNRLPKDAPAGTVDRRFDHCITVVGAERDDQGHVRRLTLAVASYDDIKDADSTTPPEGLGQINQYIEELVVTFDAHGLITGSQTTWTTEPEGLVAPRYSAANTLMELNKGGIIFAGRWGS